MKRQREYQLLKRNIVIDVEEEEEEANSFEINEKSDNKLVRRWEDLDHGILVSIMQRLYALDLANDVCFVCKTWLDAVLDKLFPTQHVLNLGSFPLMIGLTSPSSRTRLMFWSLIELHLNRKPAIYYTKLVLPYVGLSREGYEFIAKRLPSLRSIDLSLHQSQLHRLSGITSYWNGLVEVECYVSSLKSVSDLWNQITTITLYGQCVVKEADASILAGRFPNLKHLSMRYCKFVGNALDIILEGGMNLVYLDATHATLHDEEVPSVAKDWDENVLAKANGIAEFVHCEMRNCPCCCRQYHPQLKRAMLFV